MTEESKQGTMEMEMDTRMEVETNEQPSMMDELMVDVSTTSETKQQPTVADAPPTIPSSPIVSPSLHPRKKRHTGIDGLDLDDTIYSLNFEDTGTSKLRRKAATAAAQIIQSATSTLNEPEETKESKSKSSGSKNKKTNKAAIEEDDGDDDVLMTYVQTSTPTPTANGTSKKRSSSSKKSSSHSALPPSGSTITANGISSAHVPTQPSSSSASKKSRPNPKLKSSLPPISPALINTESETKKSNDTTTTPTLNITPNLLGEYDPAAVVTTLHAEVEKERLEGEKKRMLARIHRNKPMAIPRDEESKNSFAQKYRFLQERMKFIKHRHQTFYLDQIVNRYPTPRFPYLDPRNYALWQPDVEVRRAVERIVPEARKRIQEEIIAKIVKIEGAKREADELQKAEQERLEAEEAAKQKKKKAGRKPGTPAAVTTDTTATETKTAAGASTPDSSSAPAEPAKKKRGRPKKVVVVAPDSTNQTADSTAEETPIEAPAATPPTTKTAPPTPPRLGRNTKNSLADSLALEEAIRLSSEDAIANGMIDVAPTSTTSTTPNTNPVVADSAAASSTASNPASISPLPTATPKDSTATSATPAPPAVSSIVPPSLSNLSFSRTQPLLRIGNSILFDDPDVESAWIPARIVDVNKSRTKMQIEPISNRTTKLNRTTSPKNVDGDEDADMNDDGRTSTTTRHHRWIDLDTAHFMEYVDVVWAKMKGFDWWPAELIEEIDCGVIVPPAKGTVNIVFCENHDQLQSVGSNAILPFYDYKEANATPSKLKKASFETSFRIAEQVWELHMWQSVLEENERRQREADFLRTLLRDHPTFYFGKKVSVFWPLDDHWYSGVVKQFNLQTKKLCILYDDDAVEWVDIQKELIVFSSFPLGLTQEAELPSNPIQIKQIYRTYLHQQYELKGGKRNEVLFIGRDFLPDYFPRSIEQPDTSEISCDPKDARLVVNNKTKREPASSSTSTSVVASPAAAAPLDLSTLNCWECGLDLDRWNGPGLLSAKYGGSTNPNKKDEPTVEVISCGRCTKVVHSFCLKLMLKRKNQTEHALPAADPSAIPTLDTVEVEASEKVLPPHLSCSFANPRCPECLKCEHCGLVANKTAQVEDLVTCDICQMRVHLQCIDPAFDPEKHQRPTDGWICTMCVQCRCCGATDSKGGQTKLPPLPAPPGAEHETKEESKEETKEKEDVPMQTTPMDTNATPASSPTSEMEIDATTNLRAVSDASIPVDASSASASPADTPMVDVEKLADPSAATSSLQSDFPAGSSSDATIGAGVPDPSSSTSVAPVLATQIDTPSPPVAPDSTIPAKRKPKKKRPFNPKSHPRSSAGGSSTSRKDEYIPFSKRFTTKWVDTDDEEEYPEEPPVVEEPEQGGHKKKVKLDKSGATGVVTFDKEEAIVDTEPTFWKWTNSFTVCQPCGYRLEKRKYCPICVAIYDWRTPDPMVQCDKCERWVHISCDPNAQANEAKLTKDNTQYHCSECLRRERSDEMLTILDELVANDKSKNFAHPVNEQIAPDYFLTIKTPMDFSTILTKLMELQYQSLDQFKYDLNLIWRNAKDYNPVNTAIHRSAIRLQNRSMELFKQLADKHKSGGLFDQTIGRIEDEEEERKKAELEKQQKDLESKRIRLLKKQAETQFPRPPKLDYYAFYLSFDDIRLSEIDTCLLCGSVGDDSDLLFCIDCGECAHSWCYASATELDSNHNTTGEIDVDSSIYSHLSGEQRKNFRCPNCQMCAQCGALEKKVKLHDSHERIVDSFVTCTQCKSVSHVSCVPYLHGRTPRPSDPFKCPKCIICRCCQSTTAGKLPTDRWSADYSLCHACNKLYTSGNVCPVCDIVYKPRDESTPMMCCDGCSAWIHMQCDGLKYDQYIALTQDASKSYFCPGCRAGQTPAALADRADKDTAKRILHERKKQQSNKLQTHIAFIPEPLPVLQTGADFMHCLTHYLDRMSAHQHRMNAMKRHQATVMLNQAIRAERAQHHTIPPMESSKDTDMTRYIRQGNRTFDAIQAIVHHAERAPSSVIMSYDLATLVSSARAALPPKVEISLELQPSIKEEQPINTIKSEPVVASVVGSSTTTDVDMTAAQPQIVKQEPIVASSSSTAVATSTVAMDTSATNATAMPPLEGSTAAVAPAPTLTELFGASSTTTTTPATPASTVDTSTAVVPVAASAPVAVQTTHPTLPLSHDQALSYLASESSHAHRKDDWRICAFCHKKGDQETPTGEGRLLPALSVDARWVHVQCALWTDRVTTNVKGQMNVLSQMHKVVDSVCTVCSLPGASLRCKRGHHACGKYHFACALSRHCLFTIDKEFLCELHNGGKRAHERQATIDKIARRMLVNNANWNKTGLFAMRATEFERDHNISPVGVNSSELDDTLTREELGQQESLLSEYYSDYEDMGDGLWKRRKLTFQSKATLKEEAEATYRARGQARNEDEDEQMTRPVLPLAEREAILHRKHVRTFGLEEGAGGEDGHESDDEVKMKEEDEPIPMDVDEEKGETDPSVKLEPTAASSSNSRKRTSRGHERRSDRKKKEAPPPRNKELERLMLSLPPVYPTTTQVFLRVGALSVTNLGELVPESILFHDVEYLYPLGYSATRLYWSYKHPGQRASYVCEILAYSVVDPTAPLDKLVATSSLLYATAKDHPAPHTLAPIFRITISDDASQPILARSAPVAWSMLMKHFPGFQQRNHSRPRMRSGDTWCWGLGGSGFFGLSVKQVATEIEMLPRAEACKKYRFKHLKRMMDLQKAQQEAREEARIKAGLPEGEYVDEQETTSSTSALVPSKQTNTTTTTATVASDVPLEANECARTHVFDRRQKPPITRGPGPAPMVTSVSPEITASFTSITVIADDPNSARRRKAMLQNQERRPLKEIPLSIQYRIMKASAPRARVAHSVIHEWGLFSNQDLEEGAMVIEYLGELIRPRMADLREKYYEDTGVDSCYMFRIDDDYIVDSTKRGNISRFINHSCDPNCHTECIDSSSGKKIVVLANRPIAKDEEITYNYFFASENEKIRCNCGAINCPGRLN